MKTRFVASASDALGVKAIRILKAEGYEAILLEAGEQAVSADIALFTAGEESAFSSRFLCVCPHRFKAKSISSPSWACETPFQVALRPMEPGYNRNFEEAVTMMAENYESWNPWMGSVAPWSPKWTKGPVPASFRAWQKAALAQVQRPPVMDRVNRYLTPVFQPADLTHLSTLVIAGCAAYNKPHTDVVDELLEDKMDAVVGYCIDLAIDGAFEKIEVIVPEGDLLGNDVVKSHLHPFIFASVAEVEAKLGKAFQGTTRLLERTHRRSLEEIVEAFNASAEAMRRQLIVPLARGVSIPVVAVSWLSVLEPYLEEAAVIAERHRRLLTEIYLERVRTRPSYSMLDGIDPAAGMARTFSNAVIYVAEALYLRDNPGHVVANFEANDVYWKGLAPAVTPIWNGRTPYIGMAPVPYRQPWGY